MPEKPTGHTHTHGQMSDTESDQFDSDDDAPKLAEEWLEDEKVNSSAPRFRNFSSLPKQVISPYWRKADIAEVLDEAASLHTYRPREVSGVDQFGSLIRVHSQNVEGRVVVLTKVLGINKTVIGNACVTIYNEKRRVEKKLDHDRKAAGEKPQHKSIPQTLTSEVYDRFLNQAIFTKQTQSHALDDLRHDLTLWDNLVLDTDDIDDENKADDDTRVAQITNKRTRKLVPFERRHLTRTHLNRVTTASGLFRMAKGLADRFDDWDFTVDYTEHSSMLDNLYQVIVQDTWSIPPDYEPEYNDSLGFKWKDYVVAQLQTTPGINAREWRHLDMYLEDELTSRPDREVFAYYMNDDELVLWDEDTDQLTALDEFALREQMDRFGLTYEGCKYTLDSEKYEGDLVVHQFDERFAISLIRYYKVMTGLASDSIPDHAFRQQYPQNAMATFLDITVDDGNRHLFFGTNNDSEFTDVASLGAPVDDTTDAIDLFDEKHTPELFKSFRKAFPFNAVPLQSYFQYFGPKAKEAVREFQLPYEHTRTASYAPRSSLTDALNVKAFKPSKVFISEIFKTTKVKPDNVRNYLMAHRFVPFLLTKPPSATDDVIDLSVARAQRNVAKALENFNTAKKIRNESSTTNEYKRLLIWAQKSLKTAEASQKEVRKESKRKLTLYDTFSRKFGAVVQARFPQSLDFLAHLTDGALASLSFQYGIAGGSERKQPDRDKNGALIVNPDNSHLISNLLSTAAKQKRVKKFHSMPGSLEFMDDIKDIETSAPKASIEETEIARSAFLAHKFDIDTTDEIQARHLKRLVVEILRGETPQSIGRILYLNLQRRQQKKNLTNKNKVKAMMTNIADTQQKREILINKRNQLEDVSSDDSGSDDDYGSREKQLMDITNQINKIQSVEKDLDHQRKQLYDEMMYYEANHTVITNNEDEDLETTNRLKVLSERRKIHKRTLEDKKKTKKKRKKTRIIHSEDEEDD
jgi:hypothetical protein